MQSSTYFKRRILARFLMAATASTVALSIWCGVEAATSRRFHDREFLYEPRYRPMPQVAALPPAPVVHDQFDFAIDMPGNGLPGQLKPDKFDIKGSETDITYQVIRVEYRRDVRAQQVQADPASVALLFDQSGSIVGAPMMGIPGTDSEGKRLQAGEKFVDLLPPTTHIAVCTFGEPNEALPGQMKADFTADRATTHQAIASLAGREGGSTPTYQALLEVLRSLEQESQHNQKSILCFTDGPSDDSTYRNQVEAVARQAKVAIWFVALGPGNTNWSDNEHIAEATGGHLVRVEDSSRLADAFSQLASKFIKTDSSRYRLVVRANKTGSKFQKGNRLSPTVHIAGVKAPPSSFAITVP